MVTSAKPTRTYSRHGLNALKARVKVRGLGAIDQRTSAAQGLVKLRENLIRDLGGAENVSTQQLVLVDQVIRLRLYIDHLDAWLIEQPSLVNKRTRSLLPALMQRAQLADSLARHLAALGLESLRDIPALTEAMDRLLRSAGGAAGLKGGVGG
jgi:hypothetical protein